jgi:hypothetical protein
VKKKILIAHRYFKKDFSESNYTKLLKKINNTTIFFDEISAQSRFTLMRHDIDLSVHRAYSLAKIEKKLNIKSTFFLLISCSFYNIFEEKIKDLVFNIKSLGHQLGLHFDPSQYNIKSKKELEKYLIFEKKILENLFKTKIKVFSFHNPSKKILKFNDFKYAKMINTYASYFKKNVEYCSDSNGYWRHKRLENFLNQKHDKVQILTHPGMWQKKIMSPNDRVKRCINGRSKRVLNDYRKILRKNGRKIIY